MEERNFKELLEDRWSYGHFVCVGLDSEYERIPAVVKNERNVAGTIFAFNQAVIDATKDLVCAYKPNAAFYEACGEPGSHALVFTIAYIHKVAPRVPVILDIKRGDIGKTNKGYVEAAFNHFEADAVTVHPYLGAEALKPFLDQKEKGIIVLCRTSNPGAGEFQDLSVGYESLTNPNCTHVVPFYQYVARRVAENWNKNGNCAVVVGATYPEELKEVRGIVGDMPILIPGIGAQGGDVEKAVKAGKNSRGQGMIINSSSGIIFASSGADFPEAARRETIKLRDAINQYR